jgi:hypothetical protein
MGFRVRDASGEWSDVLDFNLEILDPDPILGEVAEWPAYDDSNQLLAAEYFWDTDPGVGQGVPMTFAERDFLSLNSTSAPPFSPSLAGLAPGTHRLAVRVRDVSGQWSDVLSFNLEILDPSPILGTVTEWPDSDDPNQLLAAEYFWDTDPGVGRGVPMTFAERDFLALNSTSVPPFRPSLAGLAPGTHKFGFRVRSAGGEWSDVLSFNLEILDPSPILGAVTEWPSSDAGDLLVGGEFFWESDPGFGNGTPFGNPPRNALIPGTDGIPFLSFDVGQLQPGMHSFGYRVRDASGRWSETAWAPFSIEWEAAFDAITQDPVAVGAGESAGVAWGDYTGDGHPDVFVGNTSAAFNLLYRNDGVGGFVAISPTQTVASVVGGAGGAWADYDNDGALDLFVPGGWGEASHLYRNNRSGVFQLATNSGLAALAGQALGVAWGDYDGDGWLDLFLASRDGNNQLFQNLGNGGFAAVPGSNVAGSGRQATSAAWCDFDQDGDLDLAVSCGYTTPQSTLIYRNDGGGDFVLLTNVPMALDTGYGRAVDWVDYDNDGDFDLFVLNANGGTSRLYRNEGNENFTRLSDEVLAPAGLNQSGSIWGDFDKDGFQDLVILNGTAPPLYVHNNGDGTMGVRPNGLRELAPPDGIGGAAADFDRDGDLDLLLTDRGGGPNRLLENAGNSAGWLAVRCVSSNGAPASIGTRVRLKTTIGGRTFWQLRHISGRGGLSGQDNPEAFFGLGDAVKVEELQVIWPRGTTNIWKDLSANQLFTAFDSTAPIPACVQGGGTVSAATNELSLTFVFTAVPKPYYAFAGWTDGVLNAVRQVRFGAPACATAAFTNVVPLESWEGVELPVGTPRVFVDGQFQTRPLRYSTNSGPFTVTLATSFPGGWLFYTLDGTEPTAFSSEYTPGVPLLISPPAELRVIAFTEDFLSFSEVVTQQFLVLPSYPLTVRTAGGGTVSDISGLYPSNSIVTITASNAAGWSFLGWGGDVPGTNPTVAVTMNQPLALEAIFGSGVTLSPPTGGTIQRQPAQGLIPFGKSVRLSAIPQAGRSFGRWTGAATGRTNSPLEFVVTNANPTVGALFAPIQANTFTLTLLVNGDGAISSSPAGNFFPANTTLAIMAAALPGQAFEAWSGNAFGSANPLLLTLTSNTIVTANFVPGTPTNLPPIIQLTSPTEGATFSLPASIGLVAEASDPEGALQQVQFLAGTTIVGVRTNPPYSLTWAGAVAGAHVLRAVAVDAVGLVATSAPVNVTVAVPAPTQPVFSLGSANYSVSEGAGAVAIAVLKSANSLAGSVNYGASAGSARAAVGGLGDFELVSGSLQFSAGETSKTVLVPILNDSAYEGDQSFSFSLSNPLNGGTLGSPNSATVAILDDDPIGATNSVLGVIFPSSVPPHNGSLRVFLEPSEAQGQWRLPWEFAWRNSGTLLSGLASGNYEVEFRPANGFIAPPSLTVQVTSGEQTTLTNYYIPATTHESGGLTVFLEPPSVSTNPLSEQRGQWRLQGEEAWRNGGTEVSGLLAGQHIVEFKTIPGRETPSPRVVTIFGGQGAGIKATYFLSDSSSATPPSPLQFLDILESPLDPFKKPYAFVGQVQSEIGYGSGTVVREKVVLTAAHVVFDDASLTFATEARWFFQRHKGDYEPQPQAARGWYVFSGYAAQRQSENTPGLSSPSSQNLDVAALYFLAPAGRGGSTGYLVSDAGGTEWLQVSTEKILVGYPVDGISDNNVGRMHATLPSNVPFSRILDPSVNRVFTTSAIRGYPGMSGGPVCVRYTDGRFYPAGIFLGGSGQTVVRAIDGGVAQLINRAEVTANTGDNNTSGGVIQLTSALAANSQCGGWLQVFIAPASATNVGRWRIASSNSPYANRDFISGAIVPLTTGALQIVFTEVPGIARPRSNQVQVVCNQYVTITGLYFNASAPLVTLLRPTNGAQYFLPSPIRLAADAQDSDGSVARISFHANEVFLGAATQIPYAFDWTDALPGVYRITAVAIDNDGLAATSAVATVRLDTLIPPRLVLLQDGLTITGMVNTTYRLEASSNLASAPAWTPIGNVTLTNGWNVVPQIQPTNSGSGFFRARWLP